MATPSPAEIQYQLDHISDTKVPGMISSFVISLTTAYIAVCLRLISRRISKTKLQADDWCIILSLVRRFDKSNCNFVHDWFLINPRSLLRPSSSQNFF